MATKFNLWIDTPTTGAQGNVYTQAEYAAAAQRASGYQQNTPVPSKMTNTALRQASLITTALMEAFCSSSTVDLMSSLSDVVAALKAGISAAGSGGDFVTTATFNTFLSGDYATFKSATISSITDLNTNVTGLLNGNKTAAKATGDQSGNNIKATYGAALSISGNDIHLKNKNGVVISTASLPTSTTSAAGVVGQQSFENGSVTPNTALTSTSYSFTTGTLSGKYVRVLIGITNNYGALADVIVPILFTNDVQGNQMEAAIRVGRAREVVNYAVVRTAGTNEFVVDRGINALGGYFGIYRVDSSDIPF